MQEFKYPITIEMEEYKELLMIRGRYDELKNKELERKQAENLLQPKPNFGVRELSKDECCAATTKEV